MLSRCFGALLIWGKSHTMCWPMKDVQNDVLLPQSAVLTVRPLGKSWTWKEMEGSPEIMWSVCLEELSNTSGVGVSFCAIE